MALMVVAIVSLHLLLGTLVHGLPGANMCGKHECPKYTVLQKTDEFEVRRYPAYRFAVAREKGLDMFWADNRNFLKLLRYIRGGNEEKMSIPMTIPVINNIMLDNDGSYIKDFTMMFWLPENFQDAPPTPIEESTPEYQVEIVEWGERIAYVRTYSWWAIESRIMANEQKLRESLEAAGIAAGADYDDDMVYSVVYDNPVRVFDRRNEVMFMRSVR